MNRRQHPRLDIEHSAILEYQGERYQPCQILNFSCGGLFLICRDSRFQKRLPDGYFPEYERQEAFLEIRPEGLRARVAIVYLQDQGVGLCFRERQGRRIYDELFGQATRDEHFGNRAAAGHVAHSEGVIEQLCGKTLTYLETNLAPFLAASRHELSARIGESMDNQEKARLYFTINGLEQQGEVLSRHFMERVEAAFVALQGGPPATAGDLLEEESEELTLVEKQEVDAWILVNALARRVEADHSESLARLEMVLSQLSREPVGKESSPLSPIGLLTILMRTLEGCAFDIRSLQIIYEAFCNTALRDLDTLYEELLQFLKLQGVEATTQGLIGHWKRTRAMGNGAGAGGSRRFGALARHLPPAAEVSRESLPEAEPPQILASLATLSQRQAASILAQIEQLLTREEAQPVALPAEVREMIDAAEELLQALCNDELMTPGLRELLNRSKLLIIWEIVQDASLLENPEHPVRSLLSAVESLIPYMSPVRHLSRNRDRERERLEGIIEDIATGRVTRAEEVTQQIVALQRELHTRFERNRGLAIARCEKDERLKRAYVSSYRALAGLLLDRSVSLAIQRLFEFGWANLLMQTHVLHGEESPAWNAYLRVIDILLKLIPPEGSVREASKQQVLDLLALIRKGFRDYPVHPRGAADFALELQRALLGEGAGSEHLQGRRLTIDESYLRRQFTGIPGTRSAPAREGVPDETRLREVDGLQEDEWLQEVSPEEGVRILRLAWTDRDANRYLLVDGLGYKAWDLEREALAGYFAGGRMRRLKRQPMSIVDRAIDRALASRYEEIQDASAIDSLTGLMNRRAFEQALRRQLAALTPGGQGLSLVLLDLDKFQVVNELCGLEGGDNLLRCVSDILISYLPRESAIARVGDDEFCFLLQGDGLERCYQDTESLRQAIDEYSFEWDGRLIPVSASIGIAQAESQEPLPERLLQAALAACKMAKQGGRNCTRIYLPSDSVYQAQRHIVQSLPGIKEALAKGRMELFAQPILPLHGGDGRAPHYEILLRIRDESGRLLGPQEFVLAAEQYDMMRAVDRWVVETFFSRIAPYGGRLRPGQHFSINLSGKSICDGEFMNFLTRAIHDSGLDPAHLGFEITETALVDDISETAAYIERIRQLGCRFSLDDFGSGYASFSYLKDFPVDYVKIDGLFVRRILKVPADYAMVNSITEIAHFMNKQVIAEYVVDAETAQALACMGVDYGQGYYFGKPAPLNPILEGLARAAPG